MMLNSWRGVACGLLLWAAGCGSSETAAGPVGAGGGGAETGADSNPDSTGGMADPGRTGGAGGESGDADPGGPVGDGQVDDGQVDDGQVDDGQVDDGQADDGQAGDLPGPATPSADPAHWVSYGNGPASWFTNTVESEIGVDNAAQLQELWRANPGEINAPPVVVGDRVYIMSTPVTAALDANTGEEQWSRMIQGTAGPAYDAETDTLYVNDRGGTIHALDPATGETKWEKPISDHGADVGWSPPVVSGRRLIVGLASSDYVSRGYKGGLVAFDKATGEVDWRYHHPLGDALGCSVWAGASVDGDNMLAFAGSDNNYGDTDEHSDSLFAVDLVNGELVWNQQMTESDGWAYDNFTGGPDHDFGTNPILYEFEGRELLAAGQKSGEFWVLDRLSGEILFSRELSSTSSPATGGVLNNGAFDGERLIVAANEGRQPGTLYAIDPNPDNGGDILWSADLDGLVYAPITTANGVCYVPVGPTLQLFDCATGSKLHTIEGDGGTVAGSAAISGGRVFFASGLTFYRPQTGIMMYAYALPR